MNLGEDYELPGSLVVELDPLEGSFVGALVEVHRRGERYVLIEVAPATGNRFLGFSSKDQGTSLRGLDRRLCDLLDEVVVLRAYFVELR